MFTYVCTYINFIFKYIIFEKYLNILKIYMYNIIVLQKMMRYSFHSKENYISLLLFRKIISITFLK